MSATLARSVTLTVDGERVTYDAGVEPPVEHAGLIRNPRAWVGGVLPDPSEFGGGGDQGDAGGGSQGGGGGDVDAAYQAGLTQGRTDGAEAARAEGLDTGRLEGAQAVLEQTGFDGIEDLLEFVARARSADPLEGEGEGPLEERTVDQLRVLVRRRGIDLDGATRKDDIVARIVQAG